MWLEPLWVLHYLYYSMDMKPHKDADYGALINGSWTGIRGELQRRVISRHHFLSTSIDKNSFFKRCKCVIGGGYSLYWIIWSGILRYPGLGNLYWSWWLRSFNQIPKTKNIHLWPCPAFFSQCNSIIYVLYTFNVWGFNVYIYIHILLKLIRYGSVCYFHL